MAFAGMPFPSSSSNQSLLGITATGHEVLRVKYSARRAPGMARESDWIKHKKSSAYTVQDIHSAPSFMPWSCKIPMVRFGLSKFEYHKHISRFIKLVGLENAWSCDIGIRSYTVNSNMCFSTAVQKNMIACSKSNCYSASQVHNELYSPILPGLPDDVAKHCLALVPRSNFPVMGGVCKIWRSYIQSKEFITIRKLAGVLEEWLYVLTLDAEGESSNWEVLDSSGHEHKVLSQMPGPADKAGFGVVVLNGYGKLLVLGGYLVSDGAGSPSANVHQYDSCLNSWSELASMNVARYDFACAEVNGMVYVVGGNGKDGENLSSAEMYNPDLNKWTLIENLRRPRWGCFACGFEGKLYVMGGRSSFTIGNSKFVDVYNSEKHTWCEMKSGCVMVTAHAVLGKKLFCMEWKNQRKLSVFNPEDNSWKTVPVPMTGSSSIGFRFAILDGKLLLFSLEEVPGYQTLLYDPDASPGQEWHTSHIKPSGLCLCSVTIKA